MRRGARESSWRRIWNPPINECESPVGEQSTSYATKGSFASGALRLLDTARERSFSNRPCPTVRDPLSCLHRPDRFFQAAARPEAEVARSPRPVDHAHEAD